MSVVTTRRRLLIVGGGMENLVRIEHALKFDWAAVDFIALRIPETIRAAAEGDARFNFEEREATEADIRRADIVFEDSGDEGSALRVAGWCRANKVPLNATDKPELCDLHYLSFFLREPLSISVGSGGDAPAISAVLRRWLEARVGSGWSSAARLLAETRARLPSGQARMDLLKAVARNDTFLRYVENNDEAAMREFIDHEIQRLRA